MSELCNTYTINHPTEIKIKITNDPNSCELTMEDISDKCYSPPLHYGFHPEVTPENYDLPQDQYRRSWGYFTNIIYWNRYNKTTDQCEAQKQTQSVIFEDGSVDQAPQTYTLNRDGFFTIYRMFIVKKSVFEQIYTNYIGYSCVVQDLVDGVMKLYSADIQTDLTIEYTEIEDITTVVLAFENQSNGYHMLGTQSKEDIVSFCYLKKCYDNLTTLIVEQTINPCLSNTNYPLNKNIFGYSSQQCEQIYNNPNIQKRDLLFMIITAIEIYVERCEFCLAEKLIEQIIGNNSNSNCNQFYFLCGDTPSYKTISSGCGCK